MERIAIFNNILQNSRIRKYRTLPFPSPFPSLLCPSNHRHIPPPSKDLKKAFWKKLAENFDSNGNKALDKLEFGGMLDTLNAEVAPEKIEELVWALPFLIFFLPPLYLIISPTRPTPN